MTRGMKQYYGVTEVPYISTVMLVSELYSFVKTYKTQDNRPKMELLVVTKTWLHFQLSQKYNHKPINLELPSQH